MTVTCVNPSLEYLKNFKCLFDPHADMSTVSGYRHLLCKEKHEQTQHDNNSIDLSRLSSVTNFADCCSWRLTADIEEHSKGCWNAALATARSDGQTDGRRDGFVQ
jgi:hypothetical protein